MEIELVVFDMAGTTVNDDDSVNRCLRSSLAAAGLSVTAAQVNAVMGLPKPTRDRHADRTVRPGERRYDTRSMRFTTTSCHGRSSFSGTIRRFMKCVGRREFLKHSKGQPFESRSTRASAGRSPR